MQPPGEPQPLPYYAAPGCECRHTPTAPAAKALAPRQNLRLKRRPSLPGQPSIAGGPHGEGDNDFGTTNSVVAVLEQDGSVTARRHPIDGTTTDVFR
jgi:hypothetical protein